MSAVQGSAPSGLTIAFPPDQLAGFGPRFVASLIDSIPLAVLTVVLAAVHAVVVAYLVDAAYFVYFWSTSGVTLGNRVMKLQVVKEDGSALSWGTGILRYVGYVVSSLALLIGLLWVLWDPNKQGWHDKLAHTVVIRSGGSY